MAIDRERVNGDVLSWASWILKCNGQEWNGVLDFSFSQKRERAKVYGTGRHQRPRGRTKGKYSAEGKITIVNDSMTDFVNFLARQAPDGVSYGDVHFYLSGQQLEADASHTIEAFDCVIAQEDMSEAEGIDASKTEITLDIIEIRKNGKTLYSNSRR